MEEQVSAPWQTLAWFLKSQVCLIQYQVALTSFLNLVSLVESWIQNLLKKIWKCRTVNLQIVLQRFKVNHEGSENGFLWGDKFLDVLWAMKTEGKTPPGRFSLVPHLHYHFTADVNYPFSKFCSIVWSCSEQHEKRGLMKRWLFIEMNWIITRQS